jgi:eukaryotic-like serine/threonine-protein kinase
MRALFGRGHAADEQVDPDRPPRIQGVTGLSRIGGGGDAVVFRGEEPAMRRQVAVKVLRTRVADAEGRGAFERECELAGQIGQHPNAADVYKSGFDRDRPYIVMRYYERGSMAGRLRAGELLPVPEVLSTGVLIASALQFAHDRGILHRDVKPENILGDAFGGLVLADFGIATHRDATTSALHHAMTPAYAAPEVIRQGGGWPVSDVWSLAATLYALLAGRPPFYQFAHPDPRANLHAITGPLPSIARTDLPPGLHHALTRALIGEPDHRTASARRLAEELNTIEHDLGLSPTPIRADPDVRPYPAAPTGMTGAGQPVVPSSFTTGVTTTGPGRHGRDGGAAGPGRRNSAAAGPGSGNGAATGPGPVYEPAATGYGSAATGAGPAGSGYGSPTTNRAPTSRAHRVAQDEAGRTGRRRPVKVLLIGGAGLVVVAGAAYALSGSGQRAAVGGQATPTAATTAPGSAAGSTLGGGKKPPPPAGLTAKVVGTTSARLSWRDPAPPGKYGDLVVSLGAGHKVRVVADRSPQVITGLRPDTPYCFAIGYLYGTNGNGAEISYSAPACIRGGVASAPGG